MGQESGGDDETPDIDGNDGMTLMGGGNTGRDVIGLLSTSEIMSKGKQELVDIYWQCVRIAVFELIRLAIMGSLPV